MDVVKKERKIIIEGQEYVMSFDMTSVVAFQMLNGDSFVNSVPLLFNRDDKTIINFLGATVRNLEDPKKPLGKRIYGFDVLGLLLNNTEDVIICVSNSLPNVEKK